MESGPPLHGGAPRISFVVVVCTAPTFSFFFFNDTATTEIYTLSLHDALPISCFPKVFLANAAILSTGVSSVSQSPIIDRKSTRLNSSHSQISYAVFCLKKKKKTKEQAKTASQTNTSSHSMSHTSPTDRPLKKH